MNRFSVLLALSLLAACNVDYKSADGKDDKVAINADDTGKVSFDVPFAKGQVQLPETIMHNGDIDIDGVKLMPGSKVTGFSVMAGEGKEANVNIGFSAPKPPAEVRAYFASAFTKQGAQTALTGDSVTAKTKDGDDVAVTVGADGAGSKGMIAIKSKD